MIKQCNKKFRTENEVKDYMCMNTGLLSTEYKVHLQGVLLPEGMYITFKCPKQAEETLIQMTDDGWFVGDEISNTDGPIAITC